MKRHLTQQTIESEIMDYISSGHGISQQDIERLEHHCRRTRQSYREYGVTIDNPTGELIYVDNGADILAVGHLDYVTRAACKPKVINDHIICGQLDDRLGVWALLHLLPQYTYVKYDILLCDEEESGQSTGEYFDGPVNRTYRYMFELDRAGTDCVTYQYRHPEWEDMLESMGWDIGMGSFSDISVMDSLGCCGVNFGIGYHGQHTTSCYASLAEVESQVRRVAAFLGCADKAYPHEDSYTSRGRYGSYYSSNTSVKESYDRVSWNGWETDDDPEWVVCPTCNDILDGYQPSWSYCPYCGTDI